MPSPPIELFLTTIASQPALRQRQEYILRTLQVKKIPFTSYDLASDEKAKRLWKRKAPLDKQQLPGILVGGQFPGPFQDFEEAVEYGELDTFLRLKETWDVNIEGDAPAPAAPIGVPGAMMPLEMTPEHLKTKILAQQHSSPLKGKGPTPVNKRTDLFDVSTELSGFGLQGVHVSEAELRDLVAELGLDGDEAGDLVKGLSSAPPPPPEEKAPEPAPKPVPPPKEVVPEIKPVEEPKPAAVAPPETEPEVKTAEADPPTAPEPEVEPAEATPVVKSEEPKPVAPPKEAAPEVTAGEPKTAVEEPKSEPTAEVKPTAEESKAASEEPKSEPTVVETPASTEAAVEESKD
ncbi:hypothetical protein B0H16DRAFT_1489371 [Mycena metata]|uniref:SH3 domain-binding glutamic acid-rich protein n=1 Tax=Mycena metata TaxID=1033252 RepID=A0AAD7KHZ8_9AGAR|nr:hypothetical protein B0H16DRAFT_1489371 [Mycena metata]